MNDEKRVKEEMFLPQSSSSPLNTFLPLLLHPCPRFSPFDSFSLLLTLFDVHCVIHCFIHCLWFYTRQSCSSSFSLLEFFLVILRFFFSFWYLFYSLRTFSSPPLLFSLLFSWFPLPPPSSPSSLCSFLLSRSRTRDIL